MSYKLINEALSSIDNLRYGNKKFPKVSTNTVDNLRGVESQGDYNEIIEIYSLGEDNLHIKLELRSDSYGENELIHSVSIVSPIQKTVTDFEPVNK
jgi:hypothetical protein